jgi:hypothetical protein
MCLTITSKICSLFCFCAVTVLYVDCQQTRPTITTTPKQPDLLVILHHPMNATIRIKNIGTASAGPSKLTLDCVRIESRSKMYSCPNLPITKMQTYFDAQFPNNATIQVPSLAPGATFVHTLAFWSDMNWPVGTYRFTAVADAAHTLQVASIQNVATSTLVISRK